VFRVRVERAPLPPQPHGLKVDAGDDLERLGDTVTESFLTLEQHEQEARSALGRLEAGTLRGFAETEETR